MDNKTILEICHKLSTQEYVKVDKFKKMDLNQVLSIVKGILKDIDQEYLNLLNQMLQEEDCSKPVIYILKSQNKTFENESNTYKQEIYFYSTGTEADVYILLHEFSHYLTNRKDSYKNDINEKKYNEIIPFLIEHIISNYLGDNKYLKIRYNEAIFNSKSVMVKEGLNNGEDIDSLIDKYSINSKDKKRIVDDIFYSKSYDYQEELRYLYGYLYSYYYSLDNPISNYTSLVEEYTVDRNIVLPELNNIKPKYKIKNNSHK